MESQAVHITGVERIDGDAVVVNFSDETYSVYGVEQLLSLAPKRPSSETKQEGFDEQD